MGEISIYYVIKEEELRYTFLVRCHILYPLQTGQMPSPRVNERDWFHCSVSSSGVHKFSLLLTALSIYIHWEYNSQHATCQELEKILYPQMISHYLSYRAFKYKDDKRNSNWETMKNTLAHREEMLPGQLRRGWFWRCLSARNRQKIWKSSA